MSTERERKKLSHKLQPLFDGIYLLKDPQGNQISETFQRLPLRTGTDYYKIIKNPVSLHGIGRYLKKYIYRTPQEFINQLVQVTWNARLYNVRSSIIYEHALILNQYILEKVIPRILNDKSIPDHNMVFYPDLGPLPEDDDSSAAAASLKHSVRYEDAGGENYDEAEVDDVDEEEEDEDESYTDYGRSGLSNLKSSIYARPNDHHYQALVANNALTSKLQARDSSASPYTAPHGRQLESGIRRGRPPIIDKPYETRIKLILKHFKKLRHPNDPTRPLTLPFDRLPDPKTNAAYYQIIRNPISLNEIRTKVRTRKYRTVDEFISDLHLMFENIKYYYSNDQLDPTYQDCLLFEGESNNIISYVLLRPEKDLLVSNTPGGDGIIRVPLDSIEIKGYTYKIGDWVLIENPNDANKPTVGQIFRLWATEDGTRYTNVCWYYRPEQTCHRYDRLFFLNEVCKTGQYRDHLASEIVGPCYVIFLTRYQKGDLPEGVIPEGCPWFICEFRYNENSHVFNRIRTWKACLPDEIRDKPEQPLIPLSEPRKLIKYESPIKDLLPSNVDTSMPIPDATPGPSPNAPPIVGLVYLREPVEDDELGQYSTSPNVVPSPENDLAMPPRKAYVFTPILQLKMANSYPSTYHSNVASTPTSYHTPGPSVPPNLENEGDKSYTSSVNRYRQLLQQQQQQFQQNQHEKGIYRSEQKPTFSSSNSAGINQFHTTTSIYSNLMAGGVLAYSLPDPGNRVSDISDSLNIKRIKVEPLEEESSNEVIWFRAPPLSTTSKILSTSSVEIGHSARYLAWKLQQNS